MNKTQRLKKCTTCKYLDGYGCKHPNGTEGCAGTGYLQWDFGNIEEMEEEEQ
jgi:hypothetical protein